MTFGTRSGGFGGGGLLGPFGGGGSDFSRYSAASNLGEDTARLDKLAAETQWGNGLITDDQYLSALEKYVKSTDKGSSARIYAEDELSDARYTIDRNELVNRVNTARNTGARINGLRSIIRLDQARMAGMVGDNEQRRELAYRIEQGQGQIRTEMWNEQVRRFNRDELSNAQMLSLAERLAAQSRGSADADSWTDQVRQWTDAVDDEQFAELADLYKRDKIDGSALLKSLDQRMARMDKDSPDYIQMARQRADWANDIRLKQVSKQDATMAFEYQQGTMSGEAYIAYLAKRVKDAPKGTEEQKEAKRTLIEQTFSIREREMSAEFSVSGDPSDLIDLYTGSMALMQPSTARALELQAKIENLMTQQYPGIRFDQAPGLIPLGRYLTPGGTPVNAAGFASQFDGSAFASSNCQFTSFAMMAWAAGVEGLSGGDLRFYSGDNDAGPGNSPGGTFTDAAKAYERIGLGVSENHGMALEDFRRKSARGIGAVINGWYPDLGPFALSNSEVAHAIYVDRAKKFSDGKWYYFVMDPIGRADYNGQWVPETAIRNFAWSNRGNAGGGTWFGDVAFATKSPGSSKLIDHDGQPPRQAFDTDAKGRSTVGRGGGNSRKEAGYAPPEYAEGYKAGEPLDPKSGVNAFLSAVVSTDPAIHDELSEKDARSLAKELLRRNDGDPRRAAIEWFTGRRAPENLADWDSNQRFFADAVGGQFGWETVAADAADPAKPKMGPAGPDQPDENAPRHAGDEIASYFLGKLGAPDTPQMREAVLAWLRTDNGGEDDLAANNPFALRGQTKGAFGSLTRDPETGLLTFASPEAGIDAAVQELKGKFPDVVAAFRGGDPATAMGAVSRSTWNPEVHQGNALIKRYNDANPGSVIISTPVIGQTPGTMLQATMLMPQIGSLLRVDPTDPRQVLWFKQNREELLDAVDRGASTWTYRDPSGRGIRVAITPSIVQGMIGLSIGHERTRLEVAKYAGDTEMYDSATRELDRLNASATDVSFEFLKDRVDELAGRREAALNRRDWNTAVQMTATMNAEIASFLGNEPDKDNYLTADVGARTTPGLDDIADDLGSMVEKYINQSPDARLLAKDEQTGKPGFIRDGEGKIIGLDPERGFTMQVRDADGNVGTQIIDNASNREAFQLVTEVMPDGSEVNKPAYLSPSASLGATGKAWVPVLLPGATEPVYQEITQSSVSAVLRIPDAQSKGSSPAETAAQTRRVIAGQAGDLTRRISATGVPLWQVTTFDAQGRAVTLYSIDPFNPAGAQWIAAPDGRGVPDLVMPPNAELKVDDTGALTYKGQPVKWEEAIPALRFFGTDPKDNVWGATGVGGPGRKWTVRNQANTAEPLQVDLSREERRGFGGGFWSAAEEAQWQNMTEGVAASRYEDRVRVSAGSGGTHGMETNADAEDRYAAMSQGYGSEWQYVQGNVLGLYRAENKSGLWVREGGKIQPGDPEYDRARSATTSARATPPPPTTGYNVADPGYGIAYPARPGEIGLDGAVNLGHLGAAGRAQAPKPSFTAAQVSAGSNTAMLAAQAAAQAAIAKRQAYNQQVIAARLQRAQGAAARPVGSGTTYVRPKGTGFLEEAQGRGRLNNPPGTGYAPPATTTPPVTTTTTQPTRTRVLEGGV